MAYRLYFTTTAPTYTPATIRGAWNTTTSAITGQLANLPAGTASTRSQAKGVSTNPANVLWGRWISEPIAASGTLSGVVTWVVGVVQSATTANGFFHLHIYVTQGNSDTPRGTLLSDYTGTVEFTRTATGAGVSDQAITSLAVIAGDRIVVEIGWQGQTTSTTVSATMNYGATTPPDLWAGKTNVVADPGWIQFSDPSNVISGSYGSLAHNFCFNPALGANSNYWLAAASGATGSRLTGQTGFSRATAWRVTLSSAVNPAINTPRLPVCSGEVWAAYVEVRGNNSRSGNVWFNYQDMSSNFLTPNPNVAVTYSPTVTVVTFAPQTAPSLCVSLSLSIECTTGMASGDTFDASCCVYDYAAMSVYNDGDSTNWAWLGSAENWYSQQTPAGLTNAQKSGFMPFFI